MIEILNFEIYRDTIDKYIKEGNEKYWITLDPQTCIVYGEGEFNNPTNLPVYHTHDKGGIIVNFKEDLSFGALTRDVTFGERFTTCFIRYLFKKFKGKSCTIVRNRNDVLLNLHKVCSFSRAPVGNGLWYIPIHLSMQVDVDLISQICKKMMVKVPGGLLNAGITYDEMLDFIKQFLEREQSVEEADVNERTNRRNSFMGRSISRSLTKRV